MDATTEREMNDLYQRYNRYLHALRFAGLEGDELTTPIDMTKVDGERPKWPSGISAVQNLAGGFCGPCVVAGPQKLGKSLIALRSSIEAAEAGWRVFYFLGEGDNRMLSQRTANCLRSPFYEWPDWMTIRWTPRWIRPGFELGALRDYVYQTLDVEDERVLIVVDSINRMAKRIARTATSSSKYFRVLEELNDFAADLGQMTDGHVATMYVSETNRRGEALGMDIEYAAQSTLYVQPGERSDEVMLRLQCRHDPGGDLGVHYRRYSRCAFEPERLKIVGDSG